MLGETDFFFINSVYLVVVIVAVFYIYWILCIMRYFPIENGDRYTVGINDNNCCIVKVQLLVSSITDENNNDRNIIDDKYAAYHTNLVRVVDIYDVNNSNIKYGQATSPRSNFNDIHNYKVGEILGVGKENKLYKPEIIYFKTELAARSYAHLSYLFSDSELESVNGDVLHFGLSSGKKYSLMNYDENHKMRYIEMYKNNCLDITYDYLTKIYTKYDKKGMFYTGKVDITADGPKPIGNWKMWFKHLRKNGGYYELVGADHPNISIEVKLYP